MLILYIPVDIDVSDESGNIKNLRDPHIQLRYANEVLEEREKLVLLKVERECTIYYIELKRTVRNRKNTCTEEPR